MVTLWGSLRRSSRARLVQMEYHGGKTRDAKVWQCKHIVMLVFSLERNVRDGEAGREGDHVIADHFGKMK